MTSDALTPAHVAFISACTTGSSSVSPLALWEHGAFRPTQYTSPRGLEYVRGLRMVQRGVMVNGEIFTAKPGSALQPVCVHQRPCPPLTFLNPVSAPNTDHGCNLKSQLTPSVCLSALLLPFSLVSSSLPLVGVVIYVGPYDGLLGPCHPSDLISNPCSLPTHIAPSFSSVIPHIWLQERTQGGF